MSLYQRIHDWAAEPPARSWYAHWAVAQTTWLVGASAGKLFGRPFTGGLIFATVAAVGYFVKELRDAAKYWKRDELSAVHKGATRRADGWGDFLGPFSVFVMAALVWYIA